MRLKSSNFRWAAVSVLICALMVFPVIFGVMALTVDGGQMQSERRHAQAVADAAAMAGACVLYLNFGTTNGVDSGSITAAQQMAANNGYLNDADPGDISISGGGVKIAATAGTSTVNAYNPPISGAYKGLASYIEVRVTYYMARAFSGIYSSAPLPVYARAVARGAWVKPHAGILLLQKTGTDLQDNGNATLNADGPMIVDSNSAAAVFDVGNATIVGTELDITGPDTGAQAIAGLVGSGSLIQMTNGSSSVYINQHPTPDPLAYLPAPGAGNGAPDIPPAAPTPQQVTLKDGTQAWVCYPGSYGGTGQPSLPPDSNGGTIIFMQADNDQGNTSGIYYLTAGGFSYRNANVVMDNNLQMVNSGGTIAWNGTLNYMNSTGGLMFYNANSGSGIDLEGNPNGLVYIGALTSGPYSGMSFWQDRANTTTDKVAGNGLFTIGGTFYSPDSLLTVVGNGGGHTGVDGSYLSGSQVGAQFIAADMKISGNGAMTIHYAGPNIARTRILNLVE
jgi:hypothetical protein